MRVLKVLLVVFGVAAGTLHAENELTHAELVVQEMSAKLCRGVVNVFTGWGEFPRQMIVSGKDRGWWAVLPVGIPSGLIMTVGRIGVGVFETVLFVAPVDGTYDPILEPAYVWQKASDEDSD
jgi:putative exosortase-associated protein (TIGR04073 family)